MSSRQDRSTGALLAAESKVPVDERLRLPDDVQQALMDLARRKRLGRGDALFLKGSPPDAIFGVIVGSLRIGIVGPSGREAVLAVVEAGHWFGEASLFIGTERGYDVFAMEPSEVAVVDAQDFHRLIATRPDVHMAFTRLVCLRWRQTLVWMDDAILMPLSVRLANRLIALDPRPRPGDGSVSVGVSQEDLAAMLGVSRPSVNRLLKRWETDGILKVGYRTVELLNTDWLIRHARSVDYQPDM